MKNVKYDSLLLAIVLLIVSCTEDAPSLQESPLDEMGITVMANENRPISFTNKEAAYYYTQSHENNHPEHACFEGLTIAQQKIFNGYELFAERQKLDNKTAFVEVFPHKMVRQYENDIRETFWMFDHINAIEIGLDNYSGEKGIRLKGLSFDSWNEEHRIAFFKAKENSTGYIVGIAPIGNSSMSIDNDIASGKDIKGFFIAVDKDRETIKKLTADYYQESEQWKEERTNRLTAIVESKAFLSSNIDSLDFALKWICITTDQLVSHQRGYGIYAGLPWFAEYWGRDQFIALPGACLVLGEFEIARKILQSFAVYQDTDSTSRYYGRVPNIVKSKDVNYHTTDGTPRFIIQLKEYVKYSGDSEIIKELYPNVKHSIEGALKNWTDGKGYLLHEDNETWMDARRNYDKASYSPRSTRANDIQALWYQQLIAGVYFANFMNDSANAAKWQRIADKVKANFEQDFTSADQTFIADRLDEDNHAEYKLRPNQLFAFDLVDDERIKISALKASWQELVYPWGTASLNRQDTFFHPFHLQWENYHKDEAYHNGTIWLWLNGIAMQRMMEYHQTQTAYQLFENMNQQALKLGVVGGLGENMDAYPHEGKNWPKLTGTYLQAWSNAEQLRIWYQYFLGVRPDLIHNEIHLAPQIPSSITDLATSIHVGSGTIHFTYQKNEREELFYNFEGFSGDIVLDVFPFETIKISVKDGNALRIQIEKERMILDVIKSEHSGEVLETYNLEIGHGKMVKQVQVDSVLQGLRFCEPLPIESHPVLNKKFDGDRGVGI